MMHPRRLLPLPSVLLGLTFVATSPITSCLAGEQGDCCASNEAACCVAVNSSTASATPRTTVERQANVFTSSAQENTTFDVNPKTGDIVAVWDSRRQEAGTYGVYARLFNAAGQALSPEIHVNEYVRGIQCRPAVSFDSHGGVWFVWESSSQDGSEMGVVARRFDVDFSNATGEIAVNTTREGSQIEPVIATTNDGHALIAWATPSDALGAADGAMQLRFRLFDSDGQPTTDEIGLPGDASGANDHGVTIRYLKNANQFIAAWTRTSAEGSSAQILAQRINADGTLAGDLLPISENDGRFHVEPSLAVNTEGRLAVAWMTSADENGYSVSVRRFDADASPIDDEAKTIAPAATIWKSSAAIAMTDDGRVAVAWNAFETGPDYDDVFVQILDAHGKTMLDEPMRAHLTRDDRQFLTPATGANRLAWTNDDTIILGWNGKTAEGDASGANLTFLTTDEARFASAGAPVPLETRFAAAPMTSEEYRTPVPPIWDPNWRPIPPLIAPQGEGPDFGFEAVQYTGWTPPDPELACGLDSIVVMTNGEISAYDKDGTQLWQDEIEDSFGFWGAQGADNFVFDPEVAYDPHSQRFFAMACERSDNGRSNFLLAVSKDTRPETANDWWKWRLDVTSIADNDIDSPNMGIDKDHVYLTADFFGPDKYLVYVLEKAPLLSGGSINDNHELIVGSSQQSMGIPVTYDADAPAQYIIQSTEFTNNTKVILHAIRDPLNNYSRVTFDLPVEPYTYPASPPQQGTSVRPILFEPRFWSCVYRNGSLWAVHHVNSTRTRARWYEINMNGWPTSGQNPAVAQWGEIDAGSGVYTFFPSINVDNLGNAAITTARSASNEYISMSRAVRAFDDPPGTFQPIEFVKESTAPTTVSRWGDYSFTQNDPTADGVFWGHHEFMLATNQWRTWVAKYEISPENRMALTVDPLVAGQKAGLRIADGTPGLTAFFTYSLTGRGETNVPQLNVVLELANPKLAASQKIDAAGNAGITRTVPLNARGRTIWMQAIENGRRSNVVEDVVQ